jgi:hypothetical protein
VPAAPACGLCFAPVFLISRYRAENAACCHFRISHFPSHIASKKAHISTFYKNTQLFMSFLLFPFPWHFPLFLQYVAAFSRLFGGFGASAYTFLRNCRKYKKLEEIAPPACYNRIIKTNRIRGRKRSDSHVVCHLLDGGHFPEYVPDGVPHLYVVPGSFRL